MPSNGYSPHSRLLRVSQDHLSSRDHRRTYTPHHTTRSHSRYTSTPKMYPRRDSNSPLTSHPQSWSMDHPHSRTRTLPLSPDSHSTVTASQPRHSRPA